MKTYNPLISGKNSLERIVSCEVVDNTTELFLEHPDGSIETIQKPNQFWILAPIQLDKEFIRLEGSLYYQWIKFYNTRVDFYRDTGRYKSRDIYTIYDEKESSMVAFGFTYYKNLKVNDVSVLMFDIESTGLHHNNDSKVLLITNTFRKNGIITRKLFAYSDYNSDAAMFDAWCEWVREINPSIIGGHNVYCYDIPYLVFCAKKAGTELKLGRNGSEISFAKNPSKFRKDGSQFYEYKKSHIYGREIVDTMFLAYKYDVARKYESYSLKKIISQESLEVKNREFYDAGSIRDNYKNSEEWEKIKRYAIHDADDALALYDLMIPAYFYLTPSIPKSFQSMMVSASGSQINAFLVRSYLQNYHSIPKTTENNAFEGAISIGNPGIYQNVFKIDVASLYPSLMIQYDVYDKYKDPKAHFSQMVNYFTDERLANKKRAKETGDRYYKDLEQAQKIVINSAYGMMGATGLNFNSPENAALVTRKGREVLQTSIDWAFTNGFQLVNGDTDSISITRNGENLTKLDRAKILEKINLIYPEKIQFEDDGYYSNLLVIKAKNYVLQGEDGKVKTKGSALKATMKEPRLKDFIQDVIQSLLLNKKDQVVDIYHQYVKEIHNLSTIEGWCSKKTITEAVVAAERTTERKILNALQGTEFQEGDKIFVYFDKEANVKLKQNWNKDHDEINLLEKLYSTLEIFETVLDLTKFVKYYLKAHDIKCQLADVLELPHPEKIKRTRKKKDDII